MARKWTNVFRVGLFKCEMTYTESAGIKAKWTPDLPPHFDRTHPEMLRAYRSGRDMLFAQVAKDTGKNVIIMEV